MPFRFVLAGLSLVLFSVTALAQPKPKPPLALDGYCPVCVVEMKQWHKGKTDHAVKFDGRLYLFPGQKQADMFRKNPLKYVPVLGGDCTVCLAKMGKRHPGSVHFSNFYKGRLYLFPGKKQQEMFKAGPEKFANVDLAHGGNCAVCLQEMKKEVPGKPEFTSIYNGLRYQFPNAKIKAMFDANPGKYAAQKKAKPAAPAKVQPISVQGTSGCAACEHGVRPLGDGEALGLAIAAADGKVYVVESADKLYPIIYEQRFQELSLKVTGTPIKTKGKFVWLKPKSLTQVVK